MKKVTPYLLFDGQAEEAARFYVSLLPDSQIDRVQYWPGDKPGDPDSEVLTGEFTFAGTQFVRRPQQRNHAANPGTAVNGSAVAEPQHQT